MSPKNAAFKKTYVLPQDIDPNKLWLMEEGHCFRSQIVNLCELRRATEMGTQFEYEAGSIETLRRMVELNDGITILPELTTMDMDHKKCNWSVISKTCSHAGSERGGAPGFCKEAFDRSVERSHHCGCSR